MNMRLDRIWTFDILSPFHKFAFALILHPEDVFAKDFHFHGFPKEGIAARKSARGEECTVVVAEGGRG